jgi:hypothetical protein
MVVRLLLCLTSEDDPKEPVAESDQEDEAMSSALKTILSTAAIAALTTAALLSGCASTDEPAGGVGASDGVPEGEGICLMNNCQSDDDCGGCDDARNTCLVEENRCIACDPNTGEGCQDGYTCSSWGICAPDGQTCNTDDHGNPTFDCSVDDDCLACSPMHQVCDPDTKRCTACTGGDTSHCLESDVCIEGKCSSKCPESCSVDNDCGQCGTADTKAHACNAHRCSECSPTYPCAAGLNCVAGSCVPQCGIPGPKAGECLNDGDCAACGQGTQPGSWECKKPINSSGPEDRGVCGPIATGCSDLGTSVAVMPSPWDQVTNTCSSDANCAGVGITLNVGQMIRDLVGDDEIDLGFKSVKIKDANVQHEMSKCADIDITESISCGVCVPCKADSDCEPIAVDPLIAQLFQGDPLVQLASSLLLDMLWGNSETHNLNFHCQPVAAGYGVCAPCSNPLQACGTQGGNQGGGSCGHSPCDTGAALGGSCDSCAASVCAVDSYCCTTAWDQTCVSEVAQYCGTGVCTGGGSGCAHSECTTGAALTPSCSTCAGSVCQADPYCCDNQWYSICVNKVSQYCGSNACSGGSSSSGCAHSECTAGSKLTSSCSSCAAAVCGADPFCCDNTWDSYCVQAAEAESSCGC